MKYITDFIYSFCLPEEAVVYLAITVVILLILTIVFIIMLGTMSGKIKKFNKRITRLTSGKDAMSMEDEISALLESVSDLSLATDQNRRDIKKLYKKQEYAFQKIGLIKYDAFNQMGGQLSFSLALLDENDNGFIINSVHSSEGCYSYTKLIKNGESDVLLGKEEAQALETAMSNK